MATRRALLSKELLENDAGAELDKGTILALSRGLTFCPNLPLRAESRRADIDSLKRGINLRAHWSGKGSAEYRSSHVSQILRSKWNPPETLQETSDLLKELRLNSKPRTKVAQNIPRSAIESWKKFTKDDRWYVMKADKGGKLVVWSRENYRKEAMRQLDDRDTYGELSQAEAMSVYRTLRNIRGEIINILTSRGNITRSEGARIAAEATEVPCIYFLPKIHKPKRPDTGTFAGRPIIAAVGSMMKTLDQYLAFVTAPLLKEIPGSLIDTGALLRDIEQIKAVGKDARLFSADVEALYPSIPWDEGIKSAADFYESKYAHLVEIARNSGKLPPPRVDVFNYILSLVLKWNVFHFQGVKWYRQRKGTAMGCSMSVFLANTFMYYRTKNLIESPPKGLIYFSRYIDDIIAVYEGNGDNFKQLFAEQTIDDSIKLTFVDGDRELEALDVKLRIESDGTISSRLYRKPTDGHQFLHWASAHPRSLKRSIPYAQLLRIKRNCSFENDYQSEAKTLLARFRQRNYPESVLRDALAKANLKRRADLLDTGKPKEPEDRLTIVLDFDADEQRQLRATVKLFWEKLRSENPNFSDTLPENPPRIAFRLGATLGRGLGPIFKKGPPAKPNRQLEVRKAGKKILLSNLT